MLGSKGAKDLTLYSKQPSPSISAGQKGTYFKTGERPSAFLNSIYENDEGLKVHSKNSKASQNSTFSFTNLRQSSSSSAESNSSIKTKQSKNEWTEGGVKSSLTKSSPKTTTITKGTTKSSMSTNTTLKQSSSTAAPPTTTTTSSRTTLQSSIAATTATLTSPLTTPSSLSVAPASTTAATTATTIGSQKNKQQNKFGNFLYTNRSYDNAALLEDNALQPQHVKTSTKVTSKSLTSTVNSKPTKTNSSSNQKAIYSLAGRVPLSYNVTNGFTSHHKESSLFSSASLNSLSPTTKPSSIYSPSSSLSQSSSSPNLLLSSASSTTDSTDIPAKSRAVKTPDYLWLSRVETALKSLTNDKTHVTGDQLKNVLQVKESFISDRFVQLFDKDTDGKISKEELMEELTALVKGTQTDKLRFLFQVYNTSGKGHISRIELQSFFTNLIQECKLQVSSDNIQALTNAFFQAADKNRDGKITFDEMQTLLEKRPSIVNNIAIRPMGRQFLDEATMGRRFRYFSKTYVHNNFKKIITYIVFIIINLTLMGVSLYLYWDKNVWTKIARSCGLPLNFNCTLVLVLMLRRTLTWLRNTPLRKVLPFDQHVLFHRMCGYLIALLSTGHIVGHIGNCAVSEDNSRGTVVEQLFTTSAGVGWVKGSAYITGDILFVVLFIMVALSLPIVRRSGFFEVFYWSHKLYLVFWAVLIIHAPNFWKWFLVPGFIFIIELIARKFVLQISIDLNDPRLGKTLSQTWDFAKSSFKSKVTHLVISRPPGFHFKPGDYVFIQVPVVAKYEWHPFSISSAPENTDEIWLHIRTAGHWTRSLNTYFTNYTNQDTEKGSVVSSSTNIDLAKSFMQRRSSSIAWLKRKPLKARRINSDMRKRVVTKRVKELVHIDGPYGTPTRDIFDQEHAVLIGSGIGITPFASILQSIVSRYKASCVTCPRCSHQWCHRPPVSVMNLKKVDFVWIIRDQRHFEWFTSLLCRLEREQEVEGGLGGILDIHIYMTSVPPKTDMRGMGLQLALDLVHADEKTDLLTGLRTRTQAGRPDFDQLFSKIKDDSGGLRVKVFFCGSPLLGTTLNFYSFKYGFGFAHEYF